MNISSINKIKSFHPINNTQTKQNSEKNHDAPISFKGGRLEILKHAIDKSKSLNVSYFRRNISSFLDMPNRGLSQYTTRFKRYKMKFLFNLASKFNIDKHKMATEAEKNESRKLVFGIYEKVKYPQNTHKTLIEKTNYNFRELDRVVDITAKEPEKLSLIDNLFSIYPLQEGKYKLPFKTMEEFLTTPSSNQIAQNFDDFKPYIELNIENNQVVSSLEAEIKKGYSKDLFKKRLIVKNLLENNGVLKNLERQILEENFNENGIVVLKKLGLAYSSVSPQKQEEFAQKTDILWYIYNSTNQKNISVRKKVLNFINNNITLDKREKDAELGSIARVFQQIDVNKDAEKFVNTAMDKNFQMRSVRAIDETLSKGDLKSLNEYPDVIKEYLWHSTELFKLSKDDLQKFKQRLQNPKKKEQVNTLHTGVIKNYTPLQALKNLFTFKNNQNLYFDAGQALLHRQPAPSVQMSAVKKADIAQPKQLVEKTYASTPIFCAKNKHIIEKVNEIIDKKLSRLNPEELAWQKRDYAIKATKTRLKLLNLMFDSVKTTRLADRQAGRKPSVSNKDVLRLYEAVNSKNEKHVRELLEAKDKNGNRYLNINEIAELCEQLNKENNLKKLKRTGKIS